MCVHVHLHGFCFACHVHSAAQTDSTVGCLVVAAWRTTNGNRQEVLRDPRSSLRRTPSGQGVSSASCATGRTPRMTTLQRTSTRKGCNIGGNTCQMMSTPSSPTTWGAPTHPAIMCPRGKRHIIPGPAPAHQCQSCPHHRGRRRHRRHRRQRRHCGNRRHRHGRHRSHGRRRPRRRQRQRLMLHSAPLPDLPLQCQQHKRGKDRQRRQRKSHRWRRRVRMRQHQSPQCQQHRGK